jgi:hypothetical protein
MSAVVNKALVRRFIQAQNEKDLAVLEEIMAPTSSTIVFSPARALHGKITCRTSPSIKLPPPKPG